MLRFVLALLLVLGAPAFAQDAPTPLVARLENILDNAARFEPLETVMVSRNGTVLAERGYRDHTTGRPTNIKSASKTVVSALVGIAIDRGILSGTDQKIADILRGDLPDDPDPRIHDVTIGHLLSMQAGFAPTSGPEYGRWVASRNWVRAALAQPFVDDPGAAMLYSTGSTHLLSAALTRLGGRSTLDLARDWLAAVPGFAIGGWQRDPQGIYLGGNQMAMSPRSLLAFGEVYRNGGLAPDGSRVVPSAWIEQSWTRRTTSRLSGEDYGYGWFLADIGGEPVRFAWGYGGQMLYVVPGLALTVVMTSDELRASAATGHRDDLHALLAEIIGAVRALGGAGS